MQKVDSSCSSNVNEVSKIYGKIEDCNYVSNAVSNGDEGEVEGGDSYQDYLNNADLDPLEEG